jgi:hypothetical protein
MIPSRAAVTARVTGKRRQKKVQAQPLTAKEVLSRAPMHSRARLRIGASLCQRSNRTETLLYSTFLSERNSRTALAGAGSAHRARYARVRNDPSTRKLVRHHDPFIEITALGMLAAGRNLGAHNRVAAPLVSDLKNSRMPS